jgi:Cu/Ag efflux pump CusA
VLGRINTIDDLKYSAITSRQGTAVKWRVAEVKSSAAIKRGWQPQWSKAVIVMVNRRPSADTPSVTRSVEAAMQG